MARVNKLIYAMDFETTVNLEETRVWLWGAVDFASERFIYGTSIDSFIDNFSKIDSIGYFHNLKFDIQFIFYWLFHNGYRHSTERFPKPGCFSTLISDAGIFYSATIKFKNGVTLQLFDSLRLINMPLRDIPKAFGLDIEKLELEYEEVRDINHIPTEHEIEYVKHDVIVLKRAMEHMKSAGMKKITTASNAMSIYKAGMTKQNFNKWFPQLDLDVDRFCRRAYKGGWTYLNPYYCDIELGDGQVYDVNSMYPWAMKNCNMPWGDPVYYEGEPEPNDEFPLFIHCFKCKFKLMNGAYPNIQIKGSFRFMETEYLTSSNDEDVILTVTNIDYKLINETYYLWDIEHYGGYKFRSVDGMFSEYIDRWYEEKNRFKKEGNLPRALIAKLMLNSLYGKFGSNPEKRSKYPYLDEEEDIVKYELGLPEIGKTSYVPVAAFITSYCRNKIIRAAIACGDNFVYADTDSVHIIGLEAPMIEIDEYKLGAFKLESVFTRAKFHRAKCYIEEIQGEKHKKIAGLPAAARDKFNFETMKKGMIFDGKLKPKNIKGGVVLIEQPFTIK